jgi:hypothetical protein
MEDYSHTTMRDEGMIVEIVMVSMAMMKAKKSSSWMLTEYSWTQEAA